MVKARKYVMVKKFNGEPKKSDVKIVEEELPDLEEGEFLVKAEYLSVDPYIVGYMPTFPVGSDMIGSQVSRVIQSFNKNFPVGSLVVGNYGWRDFTIDGGNKLEKHTFIVPPYILPYTEDFPSSLALGVLGMPGNVSYFGFLEICQPKEGEVVVITGAAGSIGMHVGQIAKAKGCKVIGFAGSEVKCKLLKQEYGFDYAYNYKTVDPAIALKESAPNGVDCYFDNVGGTLSTAIINQMNNLGRISWCGAMSMFQSDYSEQKQVLTLHPSFIGKQLKLEGFVANRWASRWKEGILENLKLIKSGKLKYKETVTEGFENAIEGFVGMLRGDNIGRSVIKV